VGQVGGSRRGEHYQTEMEGVTADSVEEFAGTRFQNQQKKTPRANLQPLAQRREIPVRELSVEFPSQQSASSWTTSWITTLTEGRAARSGEVFLDCCPAEQTVGSSFLSWFTRDTQSGPSAGV